MQASFQRATEMLKLKCGTETTRRRRHMQMRRPEAPSSLATFLFFLTVSCFGLIAAASVTCDRKTFTSIAEENIWYNHCPRLPSFHNPGLYQLLLSDVWSRENEINEIDLMSLRPSKQREIRDSCVHNFTDTCLHPDILDQAVAPNEQTVVRADTALERSTLCLHPWCLLLTHSQSWWTVLTRCRTLNVKLLSWKFKRCTTGLFPGCFFCFCVCMAWRS